MLNSAAARLGQALRETQDALVRDNLESSASIINCVNGQNGDIPTEMSIEDVDDVVTVLQNNSGEYITSIVEADLKFGTSPIGDSYGCMLTTRMIPVLTGIKGFTRKFQYPNISQTLSTEWGGVDNVRFFISEQGSVTPTASLLGNDIANCFVSAKEAYKVVWQAGGKAKFIYLPPGHNNDPCINKILNVHVKSLLIDLEAYSESHGDRAELVRDRERLSEETLNWDATVRTMQRKALKLAEMTNSLIRRVTTWLRHTAGCSFKDETSFKSSLIDLEAYGYVIAA